MYPNNAYVVARLLQLYAQERQAEAERARRSGQAPRASVLARCAARLSAVLRAAVCRVVSVCAEHAPTSKQATPRLANECIGA